MCSADCVPPGKLRSPTAASFVRPSRPAAPPSDFLSALHEKYASDASSGPGGGVGAGGTAGSGPHRAVVISGKVAEEVGFDKIRRKQAQLSELKIVILDGLRITQAYPPSPNPAGPHGGASQRIGDVCPKVVELDLSRNLFARFKDVVEVSAELSELRGLKVK